MLNAQLHTELETEIRCLFPESGMAEQYTPLVMGVVNAMLIKASFLTAANDKDVLHLLMTALSQSKQQRERNEIKWTGSKVGLVELIYALHTEGVFNNGKAQLKDITAFFESSCGVTLVNVPNQFQEIRGRKNEPTRFLDSMKEKLVQRIVDADG